MSDGYMRYHESGTAKRKKKRKERGRYEENEEIYRKLFETKAKGQRQWICSIFNTDWHWYTGSSRFTTFTAQPAQGYNFREQNTSLKLPETVEEAMPESHPNQILKVQQDPATLVIHWCLLVILQNGKWIQISLIIFQNKFHLKIFLLTITTYQKEILEVQRNMSNNVSSPEPWIMVKQWKENS